MLRDQDPWSTATSIPTEAPVTLMDIRKDLEAILRESWDRQRTELTAGITQDISQELRNCIDEVLRRCNLGRQLTAADFPCTRPMTPADFPCTRPMTPADFPCARPVTPPDGPAGRPMTPADVPHELHAWPACPEVGQSPSKQSLLRQSAKVHPIDMASPGAWAAVEEPQLAPSLPPINVISPPDSEIQEKSKIRELSPPGTPRLGPRRVTTRHSCISVTKFENERSEADLRTDLMLTRKIKGAMNNTHRFNQAMQAELRAKHDSEGAMRGSCSWLLLVVTNTYFDYFIFGMLLLNACIIGAQVDLLATTIDDELPIGYKVLNIGFTLLFMAELALRWVAWGRRFFKMDDYLWNVFDISVVGFSILDEAAQIWMQGTKSGEVIDSMGVLRLLRVGRLARIVRMVRIIPTLKSMVYLILASMPSFVWTVVLMLMLMFCIAVYFTEVATDLMRLDMGEPTLADTWGSVGSSIMSLWSAITGGDDWRNFTDVFGDNSFYMVNLVLFSLFISFAVLVMLNLVTGVFVDGMQRIIRDDQERELVKTAVQVFSEADIDQNQDLSEEEFKAVMDSQAMVDFFLQLGIQADESMELFHVLDVDGSGALTLAEFIYGCARISANARVVDVALAERAVRTRLEDAKTMLDSVQQDVADIKEKILCMSQTVNSSPRGELPKQHHRLYAEKQSLFLRERYVCGWDMDDAE